MTYTGAKGEKAELKEELIVLNLEASDDKGAIRKIAERLVEGNYVKESFIEAIIEREKNFPTGIETGSIGVAIPHTDIVHVNKPSMAMGILKKPITFKGMGTDEDVEVGLIFVLAIKDPKEQLDMLKNLVGIFQDQNILMNIYRAEDKVRVKKIIDSILNPAN